MTKEYTREFKKEAVQWAESSHKPYAEVARLAKVPCTVGDKNTNKTQSKHFQAKDS